MCVTLMTLPLFLTDFYGGWVTKEISGGKKGFKGGESTLSLLVRLCFGTLIVGFTSYPFGAGLDSVD